MIVGCDYCFKLSFNGAELGMAGSFSCGAVGSEAITGGGCEV